MKDTNRELKKNSIKKIKNSHANENEKEDNLRENRAKLAYKSFRYKLFESFMLKNKTLNLFYKTSLIDPLWMRFLLLITFINLASTCNALFSYNKVEDRFSTYKVNS